MHRLSWPLLSGMANLKQLKIQPRTYQVYNETLSFRCGPMHTKFLLSGPSHYPYEGKLFLKTKRALSIRCIEEDKMYKKGSSYGIFDVDLDGVKGLLAWGTGKDKGALFELGDQEMNLKIQRTKVDKQIKDKDKVQNETQPQHQLLNFTLKSKSKSYSFQVPETTFQILLTTLNESLFAIYGVQSEYELQLSALMGKLERGQILDEEEAENRGFVL